MTEAEYVAKVKGFQKKCWKEKEATMYVAFICNRTAGGTPETFKEFYPPFDEEQEALPTDDEIDKMFEGCQ